VTADFTLQQPPLMPKAVTSAIVVMDVRTDAT